MKTKFWAGAVCCMMSSPLGAQTVPDVSTLQAQLAELKQQQKESAEKIAKIEAELALLKPVSPPVTPAVSTLSIPSASRPLQSGAQKGEGGPLDVSGDIRLRYESNFGDAGVRNRDRFVIRARLRGQYRINAWLTAGAQLVTGDADDPNSSDQTLGGFGDDLDESLDQLWLRARFGRVEVTGGKIPLPFRATDMVWDGDVSPHGVSALWKGPVAPGIEAELAGLYAIVDEASAGKDSRMIGGQAAMTWRLDRTVKVEAALAYYDYRLSSTAGGDPGDFRSNRFAAGRYLSDFDMLDAIGAIEWGGLGDRWPTRLTVDYVHNFGAPKGLGDGLSVGASVGRRRSLGDWRLAYGFADTDVDAVLAAFSEDNTALASNAIQHSIAVDHVIRPGLMLNTTFYRYRPKSRLYWHALTPADWRSRLRLNLLAEF